MGQMLKSLTALALITMLGSAGSAQLKVITADTNLADIARQVGGSRVVVESLSRGTDDPHMAEPRPSMVVKLASADVFARIGMDLDMWADALLERCGNRKVQRGGRGYVDCSANVKVLEAPKARLDPSMGDLHAYGNPHYLLDPANGIIVAGNVAATLIRVDPSNRSYYEARFKSFGQQIRGSLERWAKALAPHKGQQAVVFHRTWVYFMTRFGLKEFAAIEPKPGVPPSPGHVQNLIRMMKAQNVRLVVAEVFRNKRYPDMVAAQTGARIAYVPISVGGDPEATGYLALFDTITSRIAAAARQP